MAPARAGSIVTTASAASVMGGLASPTYTCSKHAVVGLMRCAAAELGPFRVRANCVSPHAVATPMAKTVLGFTDDEELERLVEATANLKGTMLKAQQDLAEAVLYLGSDESKVRQRAQPSGRRRVHRDQEVVAIQRCRQLLQLLAISDEGNGTVNAGINILPVVFAWCETYSRRWF
ncbi:momilactone A synthase-like [Musa acuminata AAA Group]|uniref:momilactone A synthase-like n=1 Tax=Musa acuminata AAA Group TaxID=214697 RepID=UPI0031E052F1